MQPSNLQHQSKYKLYTCISWDNFSIQIHLRRKLKKNVKQLLSHRSVSTFIKIYRETFFNRFFPFAFIHFVYVLVDVPTTVWLHIVHLSDVVAEILGKQIYRLSSPYMYRMEKKCALQIKPY